MRPESERPAPFRYSVGVGSHFLVDLLWQAPAPVTLDHHKAQQRAQWDAAQQRGVRKRRWRGLVIGVSLAGFAAGAGFCNEAQQQCGPKSGVILQSCELSAASHNRQLEFINTGGTLWRGRPESFARFT